MRGHTYETELWPSQPSGPSRPLQPSRSSRPPVAAKRHGYTQNHAHYQDHLNVWSRKTSLSENTNNHVVAVLVCIGFVRPGQKKIVIVDVSIQ